MLRPFLMIGVGGSGGKTLRVVRDDLMRRMEQLGWAGDLPRAWQFLHIDVPTQADGDDPDMPAQLPAVSYQGLVRVGITYRHIDAALAGTGRTPLGDAMGTWRPNPDKVNIPASKGAGQYRALGRIIAISGLADIRDALATARRNLTGADVIAELQRATRMLSGHASAATPDPVVLVVSSIAGGSGAGATIDVCDAVRALGDPWASESIGLLYAPDVFDYLPEEHRRGVRPNSLATLGEILSGYWNNDGPSDETQTILARYGIQLGAVNRLGPRYPFLVGNRNEYVSYATQNDVYRSMGRSIASWVASETLQDRLGAYVQGNWTSTAQSMTDNLPIHTAGTETPFSALGSARVGLGRDRFRDYAAEYLAKASVERILRRHEELRQPNDDRIERSLVEDTARDIFGSFLAGTGLNERGEDNDDILDALRAEDQVDRGKQLVDTVTGRVAAGVPQKGLSAMEVRHRVISEVGARKPTFHDELRATSLSQGRDWVKVVQRRLADQTARSVALHGGPVTAKMLGMLIQELKEVREELKGESARYHRWAQSGEQLVSQEVEKGGSTMTASSPAIRAGVQRAVDVLGYQDEAELRDVAVRLIPDLNDNLVAPLQEAVSRGYKTLAQEESSFTNGQPSPITMWPEGDLVPTRLKPAPNEFMLEPTTAYPTILSSLISRSVVSREPGAARKEVVTQVALGADDIVAGAQGLLTQTTAWVPKIENLQSGMVAAASRAAFQMAASGAQILDRARRWLEREGTAVGTYVHEGLRDYLDPTRVEPDKHAERLAAFEGQFIAALNAAVPLVSINPGVLVQVHGIASASYVDSFSEIPLPDNSRARAVVERVLQEKGQWSNDIANVFGDGPAASIDIFSVLASPYEPVVFDSLMKPIASEWGVRGNTPDTRAEFWRWRRARPLTESLPVSPSIRRAMIRGWFTARLLNQLKLDVRSARIWVPDQAGSGGRLREFPTPLLAADATQTREMLPVVLESLLLAMVAVNTEASLLPLVPYSRLRDLGRSGMGGGYESYQQASSALLEWVLEGKNPVADGESKVTWEERRDEVLRHLERLTDNYSSYFESVVHRIDVFDMPNSFDLRFDVLSALGDLTRAVRHIQKEDGGDW